MSRGTHYELEGLLLAGNIYPVLRIDGGGQWRLDLPSRYHKLIGRRVRVTGRRSEFDMLDVERIVILGQCAPHKHGLSDVLLILFRNFFA